MQLLTFLYPTLFALLLTPSPISSTAAAAAAGKKVPKNAILLSNVKSLTLRENAKTSHRRVSAIPQLTCKGPACAHHRIEIMRCTNAGADYNTEDIQWSCSASLPADFKLGSTDVICEGYSSPDDDYVLKGSCGVEYRLLYTEAGEEKYGGGGWFGGGGGKGEGEGWTIDGIIFTVLFVAVLLWICWALYTGVRDAPAPGAGRAPRRGGGWGGGGGADDPYDPPPPYPGKRYGSAEQQQGWRPGFWSGSAAGAAAGYMAGRAGNQRQPDVPQGGGGWFGGGGRNSGGGSGWGGGGPSRSGSSSSSSARHESTGFGSTSRR